MPLKKADLKSVTINAYSMRPDWVYIEWFQVPKELRRRGIGSAAYKAWEKRLPKSVRYISLHAADAGPGYSGPFWESLGFIYRWDFGYSPDVSDDLYEDSHAMIKGVNGARAPKTVDVDPSKI